MTCSTATSSVLSARRAKRYENCQEYEQSSPARTTPQASAQTGSAEERVDQSAFPPFLVWRPCVCQSGISRSFLNQPSVPCAFRVSTRKAGGSGPLLRASRSLHIFLIRIRTVTTTDTPDRTSQELTGSEHGASVENHHPCRVS